MHSNFKVETNDINSAVFYLLFVLLGFLLFVAGSLCKSGTIEQHKELNEFIFVYLHGRFFLNFNYLELWNFLSNHY